MKLISRILSSQAIAIKGGKANSLKGNHAGRFLSELSSTCDLNHIESGEIWISQNGHITFSKEIPVNKHQQFRNAISNSNTKKR